MGAVIAPRDAGFGNDTFCGVSSMTPGALERDNRGVRDLLGVIGAALVAEGLSRVKESLLTEVNGALAGNAQIVPEEYTRNLIDIASIDKD
jgi:hypothetical protein